MSGKIVVGIDGSAASDAALQWAAAEARLRNARLQVVHGWHLPAFAALPAAPPVVYRDAVEEDAEHLIAEALKDARLDDLDVEACAVAAPGALALIERSRDADLVVVGSRGRGGFAGLVLGSVSQQVVSHAKCPVVVVRAEAS